MSIDKETIKIEDCHEHIPDLVAVQLNCFVKKSSTVVDLLGGIEGINTRVHGDIPLAIRYDYRLEKTKPNSASLSSSLLVPPVVSQIRPINGLLSKIVSLCFLY